MVSITRILLHGQLLAFFCCGLVGYAAVATLLDYRCRQATFQATAAILLQLPPAALTEISI